MGYCICQKLHNKTVKKCTTEFPKIAQQKRQKLHNDIEKIQKHKFKSTPYNYMGCSYANSLF